MITIYLVITCHGMQDKKISNIVSEIINIYIFYVK